MYILYVYSGSGSSQYIMAQFDIQRALCVNGVAVPVKRGVHGIVDPYSLSELGLDCMSVSLVKFATKNEPGHSWLFKVLKLPCFGWWKNTVRIPLFLEVLQLIRAKKEETRMA